MRKSKTGRRGRFVKHFGLSKTLGRERGFTLAELMICVLILGIMMSISVIAYVSGTRKSEVVAAAQQVKQLFRNVYSLASSGATSGGTKKIYRVTFHHNGQTPKNACLLEVSTNGGTVYAEVPPDANGGSYSIVPSTNWIQLGTPDIQMTYTSPVINYVPRGSIVEVFLQDVSPFTLQGDEMVTVGSQSDPGMQRITVNNWGTIDE